MNYPKFTDFILSIANSHKDNGKLSTAEKYRAAAASFRRFLAIKKMPEPTLPEITHPLISAYETYLLESGLIPNTTSFYMRILRAAYNRAVDEDIIPQARPFRRVYTGVAKTIKRAISLQELRNIKNLNLSKNPTLAFARDIFILVFCLRGISFIDLAYLRKTDLRGTHIHYNRRKTGQLLSIRWTHQMQEIINRYPSPSDSPFLLPILPAEEKTRRSTYRNTSSLINRRLKTIAAMAGIANVRLTLYVARHTWASIAHNQGIPLPLITQGMGHDSETTTRIYLATLDTTALDAANDHLTRLLQ